MTDQTHPLKTNYEDITVTMPDYTLSSGATITTSYTGPQSIGGYPQATDTFTMSGDTITVNTDTLTPVTFGLEGIGGDTYIKLGQSILTEEKFQKLEALVDIIDGMEESDLLDMLNTQILLNKVKNGETTSD
jgi:hypothetical protein